ncbi:hypothetical protein FWF89_01220 [Candidatus Saccharibacteria bacterium]|nr:hypothetical protein [Candidatus Saccharibacteria bacterium]
MPSTDLVAIVTTRKELENISLGVTYDKHGIASPLIPRLSDTDSLMLAALRHPTPAVRAVFKDLNIDPQDFRNRLWIRIDESI